ncbi:MAG: hypothetical protein WCC37_06855 [Candidatus Sulfotelmatobacter sp.]|jgi:hypothetical protein
MSDELAPAVAALQKKLEEQQKTVAETKKTINMLLKMMGQGPAYRDDEDESSGIIRADQYYGKGLATAAQEYLTMRKQACQPEEILRGMIAGGFDFDVIGWKEADRARSLSMSLAKNVAKFHRLKNGSFGLKSWYDADFLKKAAAKRVSMNPATFTGGEEEEEAKTNGEGYVPKVGDYVQWEPKGILQFSVARRIVRLSDDGAFAFVEGDNTGLPIEELTLEEKPVSLKDSAKTKSRPTADRTA